MKPRRQAQRIPAQRRGRRAGPLPGARRMACAALLSCAAALAACGGGGGSSTAPPEMMPPEMMPPPAQAALTVMAGGSASGGGSVSVAVGSGVAGVVGAGASSSVAAAGDTVTLTATAADGWAFAGWTLSGGLACADGPAGNPCTLAAGSLGAGATAEAAFALVATTLTVSAGPNGSVDVEVDGADAVTVAAGESTDVAVSVLSSATTLTAVASAGHAFTGWALAGGNGSLACAEGAPSSNPCTLALGSFSAGATATATFEAVQRTLTVTAGPNGSVDVEVDGADAVTVAAGESTDVAVTAADAATLTATASGGYAFTGWALSVGLACAEGASSSNPCTLALGSLSAGATATAAFALVATTLTVTAGPGGSVDVEVDGADARTVAAGESTDVAVSVLSSATTLTAVASAGHAFTGWALAGGNGSLACAGGAPSSNPCTLALGSFSADATATATFEVVQRTLTAAAGAGGSVDVEVDGADAVTVAAGESTDVAVSAAAATLTATASGGYAFTGWALSVGLACAEGASSSNPCTLALGSLGAGATAEAAFALVATTLTVTAGPGGSVDVEVDGADAVTVAAGESTDVAVSVLSSATTLTAVASAGHAFTGWALAGGNGSLACAGGAPSSNPCTLALGSFSADATATATFEVVQRTLTAAAGAGGSVDVEVDGADAVTVAAGESTDVAVTAAAAATLTATASGGYAFTGWALSVGLACAEGASSSNPCTLALGSLGADASARAAFVALSALTVTVGLGGSVSAEVDGADAVTVAAGESTDVAVSVLSAATLTATASGGYAFTGWALSVGNGSLACAEGASSNPCTLALGSFTADATATAVFAAVFAMEVSAGAGGSVAVTASGAAAGSVTAGNSTDVAVVAGSEVVLEALPANPNVFAGWTGACAGAVARCELAPTAGASAAATFGSVAMTLAVSAGAGGGVDVVIGQAATRTVGARSESTYVVAAASPAALTARPGFGRLFERWTPLDGLDLPCADPDSAACELDAGTASGGAAAAFGTRQSTLTVSAGDGGSVAVSVGDLAVTVTAGNSTDVAVTVDDAVALAAMPAVPPARFVHWALSDGLACAGGLEASPCMLDPVGADGSAAAVFSPLPDAVTWIGPGAVEGSGLALTAVPYADGAFEEWRGGDCDGSAALECMRPDSGYPVAVFRPFVAAGIKSLAFGLGYQGESPDSFQVRLNRGLGAGYELPPALEGLPGSGQASARLQVPVHLLPWGVGNYLTSACDASNMCEAALGGERALEQADSVAATGYFKAPSAATDDQFGWDLALSGDGATLAVGVPQEDSASTGTFAPDGEGYQAALDSRGASNSGAVIVYRRSSAGQWRVEAFVKAPVVDREDEFGTALALSTDGAALVVGAPFEDSASTGTFVPDGEGYQAALDSRGASNSGAVTVYRRSGSTWRVEAFIKAPEAGSSDNFGASLALSADGATLAVGAYRDDSASTGTFAPNEPGYQAALDSDGVAASGAVTVYRRSDVDSRWTIEAFIKAPEVDVDDWFGYALGVPGHPLALSTDGATLAVGAAYEDSASTGTFAPDGTGYQAALDSRGASNSGAVTVYRRSGSTWRVEAFVKAPNTGADDEFGRTLALSGDGATLAVGAHREDSASTGTFVPGGEGYQAALDSDGAYRSGAVTVYRRSDVDSRWTIEAFVKAPNAGVDTEFGISLDLSSGGVVMAVGSSGEDSSFSGVFAPDDPAYQTALDNDAVFRSGAAYIYRHPSGPGAWTVGSFVKAPKADDPEDAFGSVLALSADGATLAVGALNEAGDELPRPAGGRSADTGNAFLYSGAVYLY